MKDFTDFKTAIKQIALLAAELLNLIDADETERTAFLDTAKKTMTENCFSSRA